MTRHPSVKAVPLDRIVSDYGATNFRHALAVFIAKHNHPGLTRVQLQNSARNIVLPFQRLPVFHKIKFWNEDAQRRSNTSETLDAVHVRPRKQDRSRSGWIPARFDTVLVDVGATGLSSVEGEPRDYSSELEDIY